MYRVCSVLLGISSGFFASLAFSQSDAVLSWNTHQYSNSIITQSSIGKQLQQGASYDYAVSDDWRIGLTLDSSFHQIESTLGESKTLQQNLTQWVARHHSGLEVKSGWAQHSRSGQMLVSSVQQVLLAGPTTLAFQVGQVHVNQTSKKMNSWKLGMQWTPGPIQAEFAIQRGPRLDKSIIQDGSNETQAIFDVGRAFSF